MKAWLDRWPTLWGFTNGMRAMKLLINRLMKLSYYLQQPITRSVLWMSWEFRSTYMW